MMKKVTAVLPARNCRRELHRCLSALSRGDFVPDVIVVDDGSDDGTQQMIRERWPQVTFLSLGAHTGYAHAANAGLRLVRTQYAFLIRPDLQPGRKCVDRLLKGMKEDVFCTVPVFLSDGEGHSGRPGGFCRSCRDTKGEEKGLSRRGGLRRRREETFFPEVFPESSANSSGVRTSTSWADGSPASICWNADASRSLYPLQDTRAKAEMRESIKAVLCMEKTVISPWDIRCRADGTASRPLQSQGNGR